MADGHVTVEESLSLLTRMSANPFTVLQPLQVPAVDKIDEDYEKVSEKLVSSIAHLSGRRRVLSETFALHGWKLAPAYMKEIIDYQYIRGVNWLTPHAFFFSTADYRRFECAPSEFFQNPWWEHSKPLWDYVSRLSALMTQGGHVAHVALYYPVDQAWTGTDPRDQCDKWVNDDSADKEHPVCRADDSMLKLSLYLLDHQYDYDFIDHTFLSSAQTSDGKIRVSDEEFSALVIPEIETISGKSLDRIIEFVGNGGAVFFFRKIPQPIGPMADEKEWHHLAEELGGMSSSGVISHGLGKAGFVTQGIGSLAALLKQTVRSDVDVNVIESAEDLSPYEAGRAIKYHHRRLEQGDLYFITNESDRSFTACLNLAGGVNVEEIDLRSGVRRAIRSAASEPNRSEVTLKFTPRESHMLVLSEEISGQVSCGPEVEREQTIDRWYVELPGLSRECSLVSWNELGLGWYSGTGMYRAVVSLSDNPDPNKRVVLDLGRVSETAQVRINGVDLDPMAWPPYSTEVAEYLHAGENEITVTTANTNTNAYEHNERRSGLLGPVKLLFME